MHRIALPKVAAATALAGAVLGVAPLAQAAPAQQQKHPEIIGVLKHPEIIGVLKHPEIIGVLKQRQIIGVLKHGNHVITMRKAGGDGNAS
jgi:uncharacterized membrane protein